MAAFGQDGFQELLESFLAQTVQVYDRAIAKEPIEVRAIIQNDTSDTINNSIIRQILCPIGVLKCGQYVRADDTWWIVATMPDNNGVYEKAILWKCRWAIKFLSPLTGKIVEYPIYLENSTQYGTGEENRNNISIGEGQYLVYIPHNEETVLLDDRFRFLMDRNRQLPSAYRITQTDTTSYAVGHEDEGGIIVWHTLEELFNEATDSKELMIANYFGNEPGEDVPDAANGEILLSNTDDDWLLAIGDEKEVSVTYADGLGGETPLLDYVATLANADGIAEIVSQVDETLVLRAKTGRELVGKTFTLHVECARLGLTADQEIRIINY